MSSSRPPGDTLTLLVVQGDGRLIVGADGRPPATGLKPGEDPAAAVRRLEDRLGLGHDAPAHQAVTDTDQAADGIAVCHRVVWRGPLLGSWTAPAAYRAQPVGQVLTGLTGNEAARLREGGRAGLLGTAVHLVGGRRSGAGPTKAERTRARFSWHTRTPSPREEKTVRQVWGWLTDPDGRVLVLLDHQGTPSLPGGRPESGETWEATLAREAAEEAAARHGSPLLLGFQHVVEANQARYVQLRMTAPLLELGPAAPDPDSGETYRRVLVPAPVANVLLGWGPEGDAQAAAVASAFPTTHLCAVRRVPDRGWAPQGADEEGRVSSPGPRPER